MAFYSVSTIIKDLKNRAKKKKKNGCFGEGD